MATRDMAEVKTNDLMTDRPHNESSDHLSEEFKFIAGARLHIITAGTALVSITNNLNEFARASWVVTAYLITYTAGLVIWAKLSDLLGRKQTYIAALLIFTAFSGGCGAAQTMIQLIVLRALQGVGASGVYALVVIFIYELVPTNKLPQYTALTVAVLAFAFASGPIFGGLIAERSSWRWVFLLNVPTGVVSGITLYWAVPNDFPHQLIKKRPSWKEVDFGGAFLMSAALALTITGLEEAASTLIWTSAATLGPLVASGPLWIAFFTSQWYFSRPGSPVQPVFPWRFTQDRVFMGLLLWVAYGLRNCLATGAVSITCNIELPIRYQTTLGISPLQAGLRLIPFSVGGPVGSVIMAIICKNRPVPPIYVGLAGTLFQIIGLVFFTRGSPEYPDWPGLYGFEVLVAVGFGCQIGLVSLLTPFVAEKRDLAVATAAGIQFRILGSALVISITTAVGNRWVRDNISGVLAPSQVQQVFKSTASIGALPGPLIAVVGRAFVEGFNLQMRIVLGFAVASVFSILLMWQKPQITVE